MNNHRKGVLKQQSVKALRQLLFNFRDDVNCESANLTYGKHNKFLNNGIYSNYINQLLGKCNSNIQISYLIEDTNNVTIGDDEHFYIYKHAVLHNSSKTEFIILCELMADAIIKVVRYYTLIQYYIAGTKCIYSDILLNLYNKAIYNYNHVVSVINKIRIENNIEWKEIFDRIFIGKYTIGKLAIPLESPYLNLNNSWVFLSNWDIDHVNNYKLTKSMKYELEVRIQYKHEIKDKLNIRFITYKRQCDKIDNFKLRYYNASKLNKNTKFLIEDFKTDKSVKYRK